MMFFDNHAHLDDEKFDSDRDTVALSLVKNGVCGILNVSSSIERIDLCVDMAEKFKFIQAAAAIHPHEASFATSALFDKIYRYASLEKIIAIGEIGLDYHYNFSPQDEQRRVFIQQIDMAYELKLPIIIHNREAHKDTFDILRAYKNKICGGMMHMFSGSWEMAKKFMDLGLFISLGGPVTFKNAVNAVEIAQKIPLNYLLLETDCPYLSPHPFRGQRNEPKNIEIIARRVADIRGISVDDLTQSLGKIISNRKTA